MKVGSACCCVLLALAPLACAAGGPAPPEPSARATPAIDESAPAPDPAARVVFYPRIGNLADDIWGSIGPGVILMNGALEPPSAFTWMHDTVDRSRIAGDVVVLCTRCGDVYSQAVYAAAPFNSVQTVLVPQAAPSGDYDLVATRLKTAEIVFLTDGDVADYTTWTGTPIADAVLGVYDRGGVIAGSGAGATVLGRTVLTTQTDSVTALANPYDPSITLAPGPFTIPLLASAYVDLNLQSSDRFGVLAAMTARTMADGLADTTVFPAMGMGLDTNAALAFDYQGTVTLLAGDSGSGGAWILHGSAVEQVLRGKPLLWQDARVTRFDTAEESLTVLGDCGTAFSYDVSIDGTSTTPFTPADPYGAQGTANPCTR